MRFRVGRDGAGANRAPVQKRRAKEEKQIVKIKLIVACAALLAASAPGVRAQQTATVTPEQTELRVALTSQPVALDAMGRPALAGRLVSTALNGAVDAPVRNARIVIENRSPFFYTFVTGWATFYDGAGVRCGEGLFKVDALAPAEAVETDMPGMRLTCTPVSWRIVPTNLLTRTSETASARTPTQSTETVSNVTVPPLVISIDGEEHPIQLNNPLVVRMGNRRRTIIVRTAP